VNKGWVVFAGPMFATLALAATTAPPDMSLIPAGELEMGNRVERAWADEQLAHKVRLSRACFIDKTEATNLQFQRFAQATRYKTVSERPLDLKQIMAQLPAGTRSAPAEALKPGSLVFVTPVGEVKLRELSQWWKWTPGASWRAPEGPNSCLKGRSDHPSVHLAREDAEAFCEWSGKRLPSGAARKGWLANIWQGVFPSRNEATDGYERTAPVRSFRPNAYGLYDMAGNVWEWTADWYDADAYTARRGQQAVDPSGPAKALSREARKVPRGGSFLCHDSYCSRYRPSARQGSAADSGTSHAGVRCAKSGD
jgi:formylglycine-generating enzyme